MDYIHFVEKTDVFLKSKGKKTLINFSKFNLPLGLNNVFQFMCKITCRYALKQLSYTTCFAISFTYSKVSRLLN